MAEIKCKKCDEKMHKKGVLQSGNSKYEVYRCNECGDEQMKAIGVNLPQVKISQKSNSQKNN